MIPRPTGRILRDGQGPGKGKEEVDRVDRVDRVDCMMALWVGMSILLMIGLLAMT